MPPTPCRTKPSFVVPACPQNWTCRSTCTFTKPPAKSRKPSHERAKGPSNASHTSVKRREFKHAHRPVPHHRPRADDHCRIRRGGLGSDVHPHPPRGDGAGGDDTRSRVFCEAVSDNHIIRQSERDAASRRVIEQRPR